uniref:RPA1 related single stranded DNA binding protein, X-linked n=1 Tax=Cyprinodon variegatus TaxID=28743 RepID=A0A3Q2DGL8_CYPVA
MESASSSLVAQDSFLQRTLGRLSSTQSLKLSAEEADPVAIVALRRYLSEPTDGQNQEQQLDSYDVTITDGVWRAKCFLHPSLNQLVHRNALRTGSDVNIRQCSFVYNERRLGHGFICVEKVECIAEPSAVLPRISDVSSLPLLVKQGMERSADLQGDTPLQVSRKHYLPLWNNDDPEGDMWKNPDGSNIRLSVSKVALLSTLESSFRGSWKPLPILVKIIHKSRLRYYGKFGQRIDYPYQAYFEVADQSGCMSLVLWNELCLEFYQRMTVGSVLYLQNYSLKQSYSNRSRPQMDHHRLRNFSSVEICLNPRNPAAVITVVSQKAVPPQWGLPEAAYRFTSRSELDRLPAGAACDVIGLVTFVGRVERVRSKGNKERFWTYRWVHAVDGTSNQPFILELFSSSQPEIFNQICPMTYLVCTQVRLCQVEDSPPYLTSSCETEIFITGHHKGRPYVSDPRVKSFIQWTKTLKDNMILQKSAVGGHYCYPPPPQRFVQSAADSPGSCSGLTFNRELESLQYREHKTVALQGQIAAVRHLETTCRAPPVPDFSPTACFISTDKRRHESFWFVQVPDDDPPASPSTDRSGSCCVGTIKPGQVLLDDLNQEPVSCFFACNPASDGAVLDFLSGINQQIAIDAAFLPVVCSDDPRAVGRCQDPHDNSMLSCSYIRTGPTRHLRPLVLQSGFLPAEEILATAQELEDKHVVCVLDLCRLDTDEVEVLVNKVYRVTDATAD